MPDSLIRRGGAEPIGELRHLMMSAALSLRLPDIKKPWLGVIAFGVTDETFSVSSFAVESSRRLPV